jgi:ABC-2 type transport system permease protein
MRSPPAPAPDSPADRRPVTVDDGAVAAASRFVLKTLAIVNMEVRKLRHDPTEVLTRAIQPLLWLLVFGQVFGRLHTLPTGALTYAEFLAPGILAQSVLFVAIFYGISVIWERDLGIVHKFLVTPTPRAALVLGKALSAGVRALSQAVIVYFAALALGVRLNAAPAALLGVVLLIMMGAALFATFSLIIASLVKTRERFMGIGQVLTMPLFFASNAIYPTSIMPGWLRAIAHVNPLTYEVDGLRALMLKGGESSLGLGVDVLVLTCALLLLVAIGARLYPRIVT